MAVPNAVLILEQKINAVPCYILQIILGDKFCSSLKVQTTSFLLEMFNLPSSILFVKSSSDIADAVVVAVSIKKA